jgi:eukaryotic-like serine/threonine-protein kinase
MGRGTRLPPFPSTGAKMSPPALPTQLADGRRLQVGERIGQGTHASVYRADIEGAGGVRRPCALKLFDAVGSDERERVARSLAEAHRRQASMLHPNVAAVYDFDFYGHQPLGITELVEGTSLDALIAAHGRGGRRVPPDLALFVGVETAEALRGAARTAAKEDWPTPEHAHGHLTSKEILVSRHGQVKVTDFGIHAAASLCSRIRPRPALSLDVLTLAPEIARGGQPDTRTDIFALGAILRFMLVGDRFPPGLSDEGIFGMVNEGAFAPLLFGPRLSPDLDDLLARATRADPDQRLDDPGRVAYELRRVAMNQGVGDGRIFLRNAVRALVADDDVDWDGPTKPTGRVILPLRKA